MSDGGEGDDSSEPGADVITLIVRAVTDGGWVMGEDLPLSITLGEACPPLRQVLYLIRSQKRIPCSRFTLHRETNNMAIEGSKLEWELDRLGLRDGSRLLLRPKGSPVEWLWHSMRYYEMVVIDGILKLLEVGDCEVYLSAIEERMQLPPPLLRRYSSFRQLIRCFPEYIEVKQELSGKWYVTRRGATRAKIKVLELKE